MNKDEQVNIMYAFDKSQEAFSRCSGKLIIPLPKGWSHEQKQKVWNKISEETESGNLGLSAEAMCEENRKGVLNKNENSIEIDTHHFYDAEDLTRIIFHLNEINCLPIKVHGSNMCKGDLEFIITRNEIKGDYNSFLRHFRSRYGDYFNKRK